MNSSDSASLTACVVGGGMGGRLSLNALHSSPRFRLVAAADLRPDVREAIERDFPGISTFSSHSEMFEKRPAEVVCVSTYPPSHEEVAMDALRLPLKGILVEKPLGHTADSGRRILEAIQQKNLPMAVPHGLLAKKTPVEILQRVRSGEIGDLKLVEIQCTGWDILNAGIHWLHFFVTLTGGEEIASVMALCDSSTRTYRDGLEVETAAVTYAETRSGIRVVMNTGDEVRINREGKNTLFRLVGTGGQIEFWGWENGYRLLNREHPGGELLTPQEWEVTGHRRHLETMADQGETGNVDYSLAENSLTALEICEAAYLSSRCGCRVEFPLEAFTPSARNDWMPGKPYSGIGGGRDGRQFA